MDKTLRVVLALFLLINLLGCIPEPNFKGNDLFTDAFFEDIVEIRDTRSGQVSDDQMEPVIQYLKDLALTASGGHLNPTNANGEPIYGLDAITFVKSDGTEITFLRNHATLTDSDGHSYMTDEENLNEGLKAAFNQN